MTTMATHVVLNAYPEGEAIGADTFAMVHRPVRELEPGEALIANIYATVDPAQSRRLRPYANYVQGFRPGDLIAGLSLGQVVASRSPFFREGDYFTHWGGWETHSIVKTPENYGPADHVLMKRVDPGVGPLTNYLGPLGGKGITAWIATKLLGRIGEGDRVLVSAAAGAVGGISGQLARIYGAQRVTGIASGAAKGRYLIETLGFHGAVDRLQGDVEKQLQGEFPDDIDVYVDNVGGPLQPIVMERMRTFGRFVITGTVAEYGADHPPPGPNLFVTVRRTFSIHGFLATHFYDRFPEFNEEMTDHLAKGRLLAKMDIVVGLDQASHAMAGVLTGDNIGQRLLQIAPDPT